MDHAGHRERLRSRFKQEGLNGFAPHEALELLLTFAIPRVDTNGLAHALIRQFGSLGAVLEASAAELEQVPGIGPQAATLLTMMVPLLRMYQQEKVQPRLCLNNYERLSAYCRSLFLGESAERFYVLCFDAKLSLLAAVCLAGGTPTEVAVRPRMVVRELIRRNAAGAVICHNHPSGSVTPSREDVSITREIQHILESMGMRLYDHLIVGDCREYSFNAHHLLDGEEGVVPLRTAPDALAADRPLYTAALRETEAEFENDGE